MPKVSLAKTKTVVILILALFAGVSVYWALMQVYQPVPVVTAARDIKEIAQLTEGDLRITEMARRDVHPRACTDPSAVYHNTWKGYDVAQRILADAGIRNANIIFNTESGGQIIRVRVDYDSPPGKPALLRVG